MLAIQFEMTFFFSSYFRLMNHQTAQVGVDFERLSGSTFHGKGSLDEIIQHPVNCILNTSSDEDFATSLGRLFQ